MTEVNEPDADLPAVLRSQRLVGRPAADLGRVTTRVVVLAVLVVIAHAWAAAHLDIELEKVLAIDTGLAVIGTIVGGLRRRDRIRTGAATRSLVYTLLSTPFLVCAAGVLLIVTLIVSSVILFPAGNNEGLQVRFGAEGTSQIDTYQLQGTPLRFVRLTSPFGRAFFLDVDGYQRESLDLYPWVERRVRLSELTLSPTIFVRVPASGYSFVRDGEIRIFSGPVAARANLLETIPTSSSVAAVRIGPERPIPDLFYTNWKRELEAQNLTDVVTSSQIIQAWRQATAARASINPGARLYIEFRSSPQKEENRGVTASRLVKVGSPTIQDIVLEARTQ